MYKETDFNKRYKDRDPLETVKIVKDFFEKYNFDIEEHVLETADSKSLFRSKLILRYKNIGVLEAGGKGSSKDFCRASGYAELYERFCSQMHFYSDPRLVKIIQDINFNNKGYYLDPNEKQLTYNDLISDKNIKEYLDYNYELNKLEHPIIDFKLDNKFIGIPYKSILDDTINYYNPILIEHMITSNGLAAGNTLEEALVQGISELFERKTHQYLANHIDTTYYSIRLDNINEHLKNIIKEIENSNKKLTVVDLSYNCNLPVLMVKIQDMITFDNFYVFGAHPIFDIALERCLTEIYQFRGQLKNIDYLNSLNYIKDAVNKPQDLTYILSPPFCNVNILPDTLKLEEKDKFSNIFLQDTCYTNTDLLNYIKKLSIENNITIYFHDNSLVKDIKAIHIYSPELTAIKTFDDKYLTIAEQKLFINDFNNFYANFKLNKFKSYPITSLLYFYFSITEESKEQAQFEDAILQLLDSNPISQIKNLSLVYNIIIKSIYKDYFYKYIALYRLKVINKYSEDICHNFIEFTHEDWDTCSNIKLLLKNILYPAFKEIYNEQLFNDIFKPFLENR